MSVRVVARVRPHLGSEIKDSIVQVVNRASTPKNVDPSIIKIPNPKNPAESYSFQFNSVYDQDTSQQNFFDNEISPTVKHLFQGYDVTLFAYGVTGTGKTHTMRGGKSMASRGVIPRLLSSIYRKARKIEKESNEEKHVAVTMSYYEIYNDRVYDLFESADKRTPAGLPIRDNNGKTVVAGLTERPCTSLKEFELQYDQANVNRSTSATKLNAHSSRSHAILCVKITQSTPTHTMISNVSAIDLAGSEDNRRTDNGKERLVESSSINKSLFVLAQCVEAISKKQSRVPYRESKMTRILSLGQNNGLTIMILNIAPVRSYHLDTLSSLNFANRTKKIEIREVENEPIFRPTVPKQAAAVSAVRREPLRLLPTTSINGKVFSGAKPSKPLKAFSVFAEEDRSSTALAARSTTGGVKRASDSSDVSSARYQKAMRPNNTSSTHTSHESPINRVALEELVDRMVEEKLASKALTTSEKPGGPALSDDLRKRLESLEQRIEKKEDARAEGLQYLLMAKQHQAHGEDASAMKMYSLALPFFPHNEKLAQKMLELRQKMGSRNHATSPVRTASAPVCTAAKTSTLSSAKREAEPSSWDEDYQDDDDEDEDDDADDFDKPTTTKRKPHKPKKVHITTAPTSLQTAPGEVTPRTKQLLHIINTRDVIQIQSLRGVGPKKADAIVNSLCALDADGGGTRRLTDLEQLGNLRGIGRSVEAMRCGITL